MDCFYWSPTRYRLAFQEASARSPLEALALAYCYSRKPEDRK